MIEVHYFARLREQLATDKESIASEGLTTAADVIALLRERGNAWSDAFAEDQLVMVAVNQEMCDADQAIKDGDEVAFFPPVTGG